MHLTQAIIIVRRQHEQTPLETPVLQASGHNQPMSWHTVSLPAEYDLLAPDGSEIRLLARLPRGSMVHCVLRPGQVSQAVTHRTVEELWFCVAGRGELWRRDGEREDVTHLERGVGVSIPLGSEFQFRATSAEPLELIITTMPPWPGPAEAVAVAGRWPARPADAPAG
jgi:mannose-6-phosphate isomerase-like protein (cupin superfamily)